MKVAVFQVDKKGEHKIGGIIEHSDIELEVFNISGPLPQLIDSPEEYIDKNFEADLILDYLYHEDLTDYLAEVAEEKHIPIIASGRKRLRAITPSTCCSLGRVRGFEDYTSRFGLPEVELEMEGEIIKEVRVKKGAPCGATWEAAEKIRGLPLQAAVHKFALEVQYICSARGFYEVKGKKAPLHIAGEVHKKALERAGGKKRLQ